MATDSGTYTPETIARRAKMAEALLGPRQKPITHWAEGLDELAKGYFGGKMLSDAERAEKTNETALTAAYRPLFGGGAPAEAAAPAPMPVDGPPVDGTLPRGLRNNNQLNIEAGDFTKSIPGFAGSDGRFAKFDSPEGGIMAANKLLDVYQNKHGLNTPAGIVGRWAPTSDGNNVSAYAQAVAQKLGIGPNDPIPPEMRPQLIAAMGQHENGRPIGNVAQALSAPQTQAAPQAAPAQMAQAGGTDTRAQISRMLNDPNPVIQREGRKLAGNVVQKLLEAEKPTDDIREYERAVKDPAFRQYMVDMKRAGATNVNTNVGGGSDKQIFDSMEASANAARSAATGLTGLREARNALQGGMISGAGADQMLGLQKIGAALGLANSDKIVNTETFRAAIAPQVAATLKATVGTANISNTDREFAEKAAGGNITLDEKSITRLLDIMERAGTGVISQHQKRLEKVYPDADKFARERALFGIDMPEVPQAPPAAVPGAPGTAPPPGAPTIRKFNPATGKIE
jgi:hypothetical protein